MFTGLSSAEVDDPSMAKATRAGNAALNDMTSVTPASIAYIVIQVRAQFSLSFFANFLSSKVFFALSSKSSFSIEDPDIRMMYETINAFFRSPVPHIRDYADNLLQWWNR